MHMLSPKWIPCSSKFTSWHNCSFFKCLLVKLKPNYVHTKQVHAHKAYMEVGRVTFRSTECKPFNLQEMNSNRTK